MLSRRVFLVSASSLLLTACGREERPRRRSAARVRVWRRRTLRVTDEQELVALAFLPDGRTIACGDGAGVVREVDARDGSMRTLATGEGRAWAVAVRRDGTLAWGDESGALRVREPGSQRPRGLRTEGEGVFALAWRGDRLAAGLGTGAVAVHRDGSVARMEGLLGAALGVAWSPGGLLAAGTVAGDVAVWEGRRLRRRLSYPDADFGADVNGIAWIDGSTVATASQDGVVRLWDAGSGRISGRLPPLDGWSRALAPSPDRSLLAVAGADGTLRLASTRSRRVVATAVLGDSSIWGLSWAPDGRRLAACAGDGTLRVVEVVRA